MVSEHRKIQSTTDTTIDILGIYTGHSPTKNIPAQRENDKNTKGSECVTNVSCTIRKVMSTLGLLTSAIPAVQWAPLHFRPLQMFLLETWDHKQESMDTQVIIPTRVKRTLWWWRTEENINQGRLWTLPISKTLTTDASGTGWGAHLGSQITQGTWKEEERMRSSNWKELKAVGLALQSLQKDLKTHHLQVRSDNASVIAYINKQGGTRSGTLWALAQKILTWAEKNTLSISAVHLKGDLNRVADFLSRRQVKEGDWALKQEVFNQITQKWGTPQVDLFASKENRKVKLFFSLKREDGALGVDALAQRWTFQICYAFPPPVLIPAVIRKLRIENTTLILIAPHWPKRPWFSMLKELAIEPPWLLPVQKDLLSQGPIYCPQVKRWDLAAWCLRSSC